MAQCCTFNCRRAGIGTKGGGNQRARHKRRRTGRVRGARIRRHTGEWKDGRGAQHLVALVKQRQLEGGRIQEGVCCTGGRAGGAAALEVRQVCHRSPLPASSVRAPCQRAGIPVLLASRGWRGRPRAAQQLPMVGASSRRQRCYYQSPLPASSSSWTITSALARYDLRGE